MVAATAIILDATTAAMSPTRRDVTYNPGRNGGGDVALKTITSGVIGTMVTDAAAISDGSEGCGDYGESFYSDRGGRGGSDYPGLDEGGKVALEAVVAEAMVPKTAGNGSDSAGDVFKATTVVAAVVITKDATRADDAEDDGSGCKGSSSDRNGRGDSDYSGHDEGSDVVKKVTAGVVVAMVADAVAKSDDAEDVGNYGDSGGQVSNGTGGGAALAMTQDAKMAAMSPRSRLQQWFLERWSQKRDGAKDFGNSDGSGCEAGEVTAVVGSSDDPGRDKGSDFALETITAVVVILKRLRLRRLRRQQRRRFLRQRRESQRGGEVSYGDGGGRGGTDNPGRGEGGDDDWKGGQAPLFLTHPLISHMLAPSATPRYTASAGGLNHSQRRYTDGTELRREPVVLVFLLQLEFIRRGPLKIVALERYIPIPLCTCITLCYPPHHRDDGDGATSPGRYYWQLPALTLTCGGSGADGLCQAGTERQPREAVTGVTGQSRGGSALPSPGWGLAKAPWKPSTPVFSTEAPTIPSLDNTMSI
ncbi:hypothetical protein Bbelb_429840 [Branchiostoma belcheri]|nr:hypothetical protein Bbelb_429840 [Branchiostoma belcheri]